MACNAQLCAASAEDTLSLSCEGLSEKTDSILSVAAVGIDRAAYVPSCDTDFSTNASSFCNLTRVAEAMEAACLGKVSCDLSVQELIKEACPDPGGLTLFARVTCDEETGLDATTILILVLYFAISFGLGATLYPAYFRDIYRTKKRAFIIGWSSQFGFMPLMAFAAAKIFSLPVEHAIGVILCGMAPGGSTSNLLTYWVNGNVALSVSMSVASTVCSMFMIPLLYLIYVKAAYGNEANITLPFTSILVPLACVVIGVGLGMLIRRYNKEKQCGCSWRTCFYYRTPCGGPKPCGP